MRSSQCPAPVVVVLLCAIHCFACAERVTLSEVVGVVARGEIHRLELDVQECDAMLKDAVHGDTQGCGAFLFSCKLQFLGYFDFQCLRIFHLIQYGKSMK